MTAIRTPTDAFRYAMFGRAAPEPSCDLCGETGGLCVTLAETICAACFAAQDGCRVVDADEAAAGDAA